MDTEQLTTELWMLADIGLAALLSALVGLEREREAKPAGLRTNIIVGSVSCLFVLISPELIAFIQAHNSGDIVDTDPTRILQALLVGISFLGAGTILKSKDPIAIRYLTTAATLFYPVGIGMAIALDHYALAAGLTALILMINFLLQRLDTYLGAERKEE